MQQRACCGYVCAKPMFMPDAPRYRICVEHSRQLNITIKGEQCRWCQQCGRFQSVGEFVGANRTCQVRLSKHNERR
jgi:hypothetical protein